MFLARLWEPQPGGLRAAAAAVAAGSAATGGAAPTVFAGAGVVLVVPRCTPALTAAPPRAEYTAADGPGLADQDDLGPGEAGPPDGAPRPRAEHSVPAACFASAAHARAALRRGGLKYFGSWSTSLAGARLELFLRAAAEARPRPQRPRPRAARGVGAG